MLKKSFNIEELENLKDSVKDIIDDYNAGVPIQVLACKYECSLPTIYTILRQNGVSLSGHTRRC